MRTFTIILFAFLAFAVAQSPVSVNDADVYQLHSLSPNGWFVSYPENKVNTYFYTPLNVPEDVFVTDHGNPYTVEPGTTDGYSLFVTQPAGNGYHYILGYYDRNIALEVKSCAPNVPVQFNNYENGRKNQLWQFLDGGNGNYIIKNQLNRQVLTVAGSGDAVNMRYLVTQPLINIGGYSNTQLFTMLSLTLNY